MSGPKSSSFRLSAVQMRMLREQAEKRRQEKIRQEKIRREKEQLQHSQQEAASIQNLLEPVLKEKFLTSELKTKADKLHLDCQTLQTKCVQSAAKEDLDFLQQCNREILQKIAEVRDSVSQLYEDLPETVMAERQRLEDQISRAFHVKLPEAVKKQVLRNETLREEIHKMEYEVQSLRLPDAARQKWDKLQKKAEQIQSADFLENFIAMDLDPFLEQCKKCEELHYQDVLDRYISLAEESHIVPEKFDFSVEAINAMEQASRQLEEKLLENQEQERVCAALDDVMREMGYQLIGDRVVTKKKTGKHIRHELYELHSGTAVDVTYADNGQISMELGGIGEFDRQPTAMESEQLVEDMQSFCSDYAALEKKLAERGVLATRISHMPPSVEYAQIFNKNDYNLKKAVDDLQVEQSYRHSENVMYMEDRDNG